MHPSGLLILIGSVTVVTLLFTWSMWKVLRGDPTPAEDISRADLHTPDMDQDS